MLNEHDSHCLLNSCMETMNIQQAFEIVKGTNATFGVDGDQYYYGFGNLPEPTGIYGFGKTPMAALMAFWSAYYSQKINPK